MRITAKYRAQLAGLTGCGEEQIEAPAVKDVLKHIKQRFGAEAEKKAKTMIIAVNGESILQLGIYKTALRDGDEVSYLPVSGGG